MIRAHNHSSYPRVGESPLDQQVRAVERAGERGRATAQEIREKQDEVTTVIVAEQCRAFIDVVTDGMIRWPGPTSHLATQLDGLELGGLRRWFDTNFYERQLVVVDALCRPAPFLVEDYKLAKQVALKQAVKVVLPGPVTTAHLACDRHYGDLDRLADALAELLAAEVADLSAAGARVFQLDEPWLCRDASDEHRVARTAAVVFGAARAGSMTILSTYFGDLAAVGDLGRLPGTHLGLDLAAGPKNYELLDRIPDGRGLALGLFDARTTLQEDAADMAERLRPYRAGLTSRDVLVGPNCGLELLPRDQAFDKLLHSRYLVEKLAAEWEWD